MDAAEFTSIREATHLSVSYLADRWDVRRQTVQRWDSGKRSIPEWVVQDIVHLFDNRQTTIDDVATYIEGHRKAYTAIYVPKGFGMTISGYPVEYVRSIAFEVGRRTGLEVMYKQDDASLERKAPIMDGEFFDGFIKGFDGPSGKTGDERPMTKEHDTLNDEDILDYMGEKYMDGIKENIAEIVKDNYAHSVVDALRDEAEDEGIGSIRDMDDDTYFRIVKEYEM